MLLSFVSGNEYHIANVDFSIATSFHVHHMIFTGWSYSVPQSGWTALMCACTRGHTDVVQLLVSSGAQVNLQDFLVRKNINYIRTMTVQKGPFKPSEKLLKILDTTCR